MINKFVSSVEQTLAGIQDGATILVAGFGIPGIPEVLLDGLIASGARDLTIVNNNAGNGDIGQAALLRTGNVRVFRSSQLFEVRLQCPQDCKALCS